MPRGGGGRGRGCPKGPDGRPIWMQYADKSRQKKKENEKKSRHAIIMDEHNKQQIVSLLSSLDSSSSSSSSSSSLRSSASSPAAPSAPSPRAPPRTIPVASSSSSPSVSPVASSSFSSPSRMITIEEEEKMLPLRNGIAWVEPEKRKMHPNRQKLPSWSCRENILETVEKNQVVVLSGETGCGKTTQVPQFLMDNARKNGQPCHVICTQPRRISAIAVANRVAQERGERLGERVGYQIRVEKVLPRTETYAQTSLFCTTGILLRRLHSPSEAEQKKKQMEEKEKGEEDEGKPLIPLSALEEVTHIIVDEIHERDLNSDFLLILLRDIVKYLPRVRILLMSATLNAPTFTEYFGGCSELQIPGFTFPVKRMYLEEILSQTGYAPRNGPQQQRTPSYKRRRDDYQQEPVVDYETEKWYANAARKFKYRGNLGENLQAIDSAQEVDVDLVCDTIKYVAFQFAQGTEGAILCFLPGWDTITKVYDQLSADRTIASQGRSFLILPLHSQMPTKEQQIIFDRPPPGVRKIILSTNIAETSLTIDDVVYVVDAGKSKEKTYDADNKMPCLDVTWVSQAAARQRAGRAGRVQKGFSFHLFSSLKHKQMKEYQLPEMLRVPLEDLLLQALAMNIHDVGGFLERAIDVSNKVALRNALDLLLHLSAIEKITPPSSASASSASPSPSPSPSPASSSSPSSSPSPQSSSSQTQNRPRQRAKYALTPLGVHLARLPLHPRLGKMMIYAYLFGCVDPVLTIISSLSHRPPFVIPLHRQQEADEVRRNFCGTSQSDFFALLNAYNEWRSLPPGQANQFCWEMFLSSSSLRMITQMRKQFMDVMSNAGFR